MPRRTAVVIGAGIGGLTTAVALHRRGWRVAVLELIRTTAPQDVMRHDVCWLNRPLPAFHQGRVALLGDAAHAMTPDLGQGGCQAIEDAVVLAHRLGAGGVAGADLDTEAALAAYTADRLVRTTRVVRQSARVGRLQQLDSPLHAGARDTMVRLVGKLGPSLKMRQMDPVAGWVPPSGSTEPSIDHGCDDRVPGPVAEA